MPQCFPQVELGGRAPAARGLGPDELFQRGGAFDRRAILPASESRSLSHTEMEPERAEAAVVAAEASEGRVG